MNQLFVVLCADTEDNHPNYLPGWRSLGSSYDRNPAVIRWDWTRFWDDLTIELKNLEVPTTWFIRVDDGPVHDTMLKMHKDRILALRSAGDEIGIHIHTLEWNALRSKWVQARDGLKEARIVERSLQYSRDSGIGPLSSRMGWNAMTNSIMKALDKGGIRVDASAIPGSYSTGKFGSRDNLYDWRKAPAGPYHPSDDDYRHPGRLKILEMPISTLPMQRPIKSVLAGGLVNLRMGRILMPIASIATALDLNPNRHFHISPNWSLSVCKSIVQSYSARARRDGVAFLVGYFHPSDILDPHTKARNTGFVGKITQLTRCILAEKGLDIKFCTLSEAAEYAERELARSDSFSTTRPSGETNALATSGEEL